MAGDRDLGVAFVRAWAPAVPTSRTGWEVTAATGVRGLRLVRETGAFGHFLLTETNPEAFCVLARNSASFPAAVARADDGRQAPAESPFDYVDVDPFGSPIPFVPAAVESVRPGGVLAVTATDMMVLAGAQPAAALRRYGARPVRGRLGPEGGLRILLAYLARSARARDRSIRPLLSYVRDHHVRCYLEVGGKDRSEDPVGTIDPARWEGPRVGEGGPYGPLWLGPLFDQRLVSRLEVPATAARPDEVRRFLARLREEVSVDQPFYYEPNVMASELGLPFPPSWAGLRDALAARGYRAGRTHARPEGFRTDAPHEVVAEAARAAARLGQSQKARVRA